MKIIQHGRVIKFHCPDCCCEFSEIPKKCYSSTGEHGSNYSMTCPDCNRNCWTNDSKQKDDLWRKVD